MHLPVPEFRDVREHHHVLIHRDGLEILPAPVRNRDIDLQIREDPLLRADRLQRRDLQIQADPLQLNARRAQADQRVQADQRLQADRLLLPETINRIRRQLQAEIITEVKEIIIPEVVRERVQVLRTLTVVRQVAVRTAKVDVAAVLPAVQVEQTAVQRVAGIMIVRTGEVVLPAEVAVPVVLPIEAAAVPAAVPVGAAFPDRPKEAHLQEARVAVAEALLPVLQKEEVAQEDKTYSFINKSLLLSGRRTRLRRIAD